MTISYDSLKQDFTTEIYDNILCSRKAPDNTGMKLVWTKAKTKNWQQREQITCDETTLLAEYVEEVSFTSTALDIVLDKEVLFEFGWLENHDFSFLML